MQAIPERFSATVARNLEKRGGRREIQMGRCKISRSNRNSPPAQHPKAGIGEFQNCGSPSQVPTAPDFDGGPWRTAVHSWWVSRVPCQVASKFWSRCPGSAALEN